jgi:hypothetical protein
MDLYGSHKLRMREGGEVVERAQREASGIQGSIEPCGSGPNNLPRTGVYVEVFNSYRFLLHVLLLSTESDTAVLVPIAKVQLAIFLRLWARIICSYS